MQNLELHLLTSKRTLSVRDFVVDEALSAPFLVRLVVRATTFSLEDHIGELATFQAAMAVPGLVASREPATWTGHVTAIEDLGLSPDGHGYFKVELAARLWILSQNRNYRIFERIDEVSIACQIFDEWGIAYQLELDPARQLPRKLVVQYGESDLDFVQRNLEAVGVSYALVEIDGEETVVLSDEPQAAAPARSMSYVHSPLPHMQTDFVTSLRVERKLKPARYMMQDLDYRKAPKAALCIGARVDNATQLEQSLERYHYQPGFSHVRVECRDTPVADDKGAIRSEERYGALTVERRVGAKAADRLRIVFETNALDLHPGIVIRIQDHRGPELANPVLITATELSGSDTGEWQLRCTAATTRLPYRPLVHTARPSAIGIESATVVGPPGSEIHTDELGRVRVQFHWDRVGQFDADSSCWLPVSQPWAGAGFGSVFLPRVGQEVFVEFLGGNPDLPVVVGRVYTALERVPYNLPDEASVTVIAKTRSLGGGDGYNEIKADDRTAAELLSVRAERDLETLVRHVERRTVGVDRTTKIGQTDTLDVAKHIQTTVGGVETRSYTSPHPAAPKTTHTTTNGHHSIEVGPSSVVCHPADITVTSPKIILTTGGGASITLEGDNITIDARLINIKGSGLVDVKGAPIQLNCK